MKKNTTKPAIPDANGDNQTGNKQENKSTPANNTTDKSSSVKDSKTIERNEYEPWKRYYRGYEGL